MIITEYNEKLEQFQGYYQDPSSNKRIYSTGKTKEECVEEVKIAVKLCEDYLNGRP